MKRVKDIFEIMTGYTFRDSISEILPGNVAVVQAGDINADRLATVPRVSFDAQKHLLEVGDILLSARGKVVARTVTADIIPAVAASSVIILRPLSDINTKFVCRYLNSSTGQSALAKN
jgi:restriction endonuclease S subunit